MARGEVLELGEKAGECFGVGEVCDERADGDFLVLVWRGDDAVGFELIEEGGDALEIAGFAAGFPDVSGELGGEFLDGKADGGDADAGLLLM